MSYGSPRPGRGGAWVFIAGGGTAGHVLPGIAVAKELVAAGHDASQIWFVGSERGLETRLVPEEGFPLVALPGRGIQRRLTVENLGAAWGLMRGVLRGMWLTLRVRPHLVVALGGYASIPCAVAAAVARIPMVVMEQNALAGAANRISGRFAKVSAVPFESTDLPRAVVTGNPVRSEVLAVDRERDRGRARSQLGLPDDRTVIGVFSGSLGATRINEAVDGLALRWSDRGDIAIHHVTGSRDWERRARVQEPLSEGRLFHLVKPYEDRMDLLLAACDMVICRSGGTTVAELAVVGMPSVLVPFPGAPRDHQRANARELVEAGAALLVGDAELDTDVLVEIVAPVLDDPGRLARMADAASGLGRRDAASAVADLIERNARV